MIRIFTILFLLIFFTSCSKEVLYNEKYIVTDVVDSLSSDHKKYKEYFLEDLKDEDFDFSIRVYENHIKHLHYKKGDTLNLDVTNYKLWFYIYARELHPSK